MQIPDFIKVYQAKSDEELIRLADAPEQLCSEARIALQGELSRRQIIVAEDSGVSPHNGDAGHVAVTERLHESYQQGVGDFVTEVLRIYHSHFWLYFKITAPAVIISTVAIITSRNEVQEISRHLPRGIELLAHRTEILEIGLINLCTYLISWIAFSYSFGAICIAVEGVTAGFTPSAWHSLLSVRERLGTFLRLCLLLFVLLLVAEVASVPLVGVVLRVLRQLQVHPSGFLIMVISFTFVGMAFLVLSRFALAVPAVILDDCTVVKSMFRSDELTKRKWLTLATLLAKSIIGGYVAAMCPFWLASFIPITWPLPSWFPWILTLASMIGLTVVEPTMFIGFVLLYLKMSAPASAPSKVLTSQLA